MLKISIPKNNIHERKYIIDVFFNELLGLDFKLNYHEESSYLIEFDNEKQIEIVDHFFSKFKNDFEYLNEKNIPKKVEYGINDFCPEADIPIIYGSNNIQLAENKITCHIDIFSSSFFMLSKWEEYVIKIKDQYDRFPDKESLAVKNNFHKRPIVNEYLEMLWAMLSHLGFHGDRKSRKYELKITHDIDLIYRYDSFLKLLSAFAGDIFIRKKPALVFKTLVDFVKINFLGKTDPYDTYDFFMNVSEKYGIKSHFYFIPGAKGDADYRYSILNRKVKTIIKKIEDRGHVIGIHPTFESYNRSELFKEEVKRLRSVHIKANEGRQHFLRFENPGTWRLWESNRMKVDSTLGFHDDIGFRAGICNSFNVFDILDRKKLKLKECPLVVMEVALKKKCTDAESFMEHLLTMKRTISKYNGVFVLLWHNTNLYTYEWRKMNINYQNIIRMIQ